MHATALCVFAFAFIMFKASTPKFLTADARITYSPLESIAGIESDIAVPRPRTAPPSPYPT
jgi:hypothetical protein